MVTLPWSQLIPAEDTPYYHLTSRCVRRAFLYGADSVSGKNYEHRRQWIENRLQLLSSIFAIDVCSYAVMSNHIHTVVKLMPDVVDSWSNTEVLERWTSPYKGPLLIQRWLAQDKLTPVNPKTVRIRLAPKVLILNNFIIKCINYANT